MINVMNDAKDSLDDTPSIDAFEALTPAIVFIDIADQIKKQYDLGKKIETIEEKERIKNIISIVFGVTGLLAMFVGPVLGAAINISLEIAQLFSDLIIDGHIDPTDVIFLVFDLFASGFKAPKISNMSDVLRAGKTSKIEKQLFQFPKYKELMLKGYGKVCK